MYNIVVQPDMQATFGITLKPAHQLQAHEYTAAMSVFYESDTELFASTFFNSTVNVQVQPPPLPSHTTHTPSPPPPPPPLPPPSLAVPASWWHALAWS